MTIVFANKKIIILIIVSIAALVAAILLWAWNKRPSNPSISKEALIMVDTIEDTRGLGYSGQRKIARDSSGNWYVAYRKKYAGKYEIFVAKLSWDKNRWQVSGTDKPISLVGSAVDQRVPSIAIDLQDVIHVVWYGSDNADEPNNRQVKYSRSADRGASWTRWKNVAVVDGYQGEEFWQEHPHILAGRNNRLFVVWEGKDRDNQEQQVKLSYSDNGGSSWSAWKNLQPAENNTQSRPSLVQNKSGGLDLFMYSSLENPYKTQVIYHTRSTDNGNHWSPWQPLSDKQADSRHISVTVDSQDNLYLAWRSVLLSGGQPSRILLRKYRNGAWSEIQSLADSPRNQFFPSVAIDQTGRFYVSWMESDDASELPRENPAAGQGYILTSNFDDLKSALPLLLEGDDLYPNLPETIVDQKNSALAYLNSLAQDRNSLVVRIFDFSN